MSSTIVLCAAVVIGAFVISYGADWLLLAWRGRREAQAAEALPATAVAGIEIAIARQVDGWLIASRQTTRIYAEGLVTGRITAITAAADWETVPTAPNHAIYQEREASGVHWTMDDEARRIGIGSIHGLARGVIECRETGRRYGVQADLRMSWLVCAEDLEVTGLTIDDVAAAFTGDLLADANAFLRACELMSIR